MAKKKDKAPEGAPLWMVTYGDLMTLLLTFFVLLVSMSELKDEDRYKHMVQQIQATFGFSQVGRFPVEGGTQDSLLKRLEQMAKDRDQARAPTEDMVAPGRTFRVEQIREGIQTVVGGPVSFDPFSAALKPEAKKILAELAQRIRGYNTKIEVRGHTTSDPLPSDSPFRDFMDLSFERARAVKAELLANGVRERRVRVTAAGDTEPVVRRVFTPEGRAANRRAEIIVTESLMSEFDGADAESSEREDDTNAR